MQCQEMNLISANKVKRLESSHFVSEYYLSLGGIPDEEL